MKKGVDYVGVCVVYMCHDGKGNIVMAKRNHNTRDEHGRWDIGGGGLEFGQTVDEALRQEIKEEYCTDVISYEFLGFRDVHRTHDNNPTHWIALDFLVQVDPALVKLGEPNKFDALEWFTLDTLPSPVHSQFPTFLKNHQAILSKLKNTIPYKVQ